MDWISVKDRLPKDQKSVLIVNGHGVIKMASLWKKKSNEWVWLFNGEFKYFNDITHWMPLPEPPKEE